MGRPDVSIVVPTRDRWRLLAATALPSALGQEGVDVEVLVVDDASRDRPAADVDAALHDPRVRVLRHRGPRGVAQARNAGIGAARAEWTAFLDDDDLWSPDKLARQLDAATSAGAAFAYGGAAAVSEDGSWLYSLQPADPGTLAQQLLSRNVLWGGSSNVLVRVDVVRALGGFDEELFQLCDWDLWIRLALGHEGAAVDDVLVGCLVHPASMLLVDENDVLREFAYVRAKHSAAAEHHRVKPDGAAFVRWVALGHRRAGRRGRAARTYLRGIVRERDLSSIARLALALVGPRPGPGASGRPRAGARALPARYRHAPAWLGRYGEEVRKIVQATSNASSPTES